jgi:hypothetical protein
VSRRRRRTALRRGRTWLGSPRRRSGARALTLTGAAAALGDTLGASQSPPERAQFERWSGPVWAALEETVDARAWAAGQSMAEEQAIEYAIAEETCDTETGALGAR